MSRRVVVRPDRRIADAEQLLLRMSDDRNVSNALKLALADAPAYRVVPGFEQSGAVSISCFAVADEIEAQIVFRGTRWAVYGLASVADLGSLGCTLVATDVFDDDERLPLSDRHVDVIVRRYPPGIARYGTPVCRVRIAQRCAPASKVVSGWSFGHSIRADPSEHGVSAMSSVEALPSVVADLTFAPVRGGRATVPPGCWEADRAPVVGERVLVADGGAGPYEATITAVEDDGTLVLAVHVFAPAHA